jgi:hypothetical protein
MIAAIKFGDLIEAIYIKHRGKLLLSYAIYSNYHCRASALTGDEYPDQKYTHLCFGAADRTRSDGTRLVESGEDFGHAAVGHEQLA